MAKANLVDKKVHMDLEDIIKFQLITHCYINRLNISDADLKCLTLLALNQGAELSEFCNACCEHDKRDRDPELDYTQVIFKTPQTVRNCLGKMEKQNIIFKSGKGNKKIVALNPDMKIQTSGNIILDYKLFHIGTKES